MSGNVLNVSPVGKFCVGALGGDSSSVGQRWLRWKKAFQSYITASGVSDDKEQRALLLHSAGPEVQDIFETLTVSGDKYDDAVAALDSYFIPKKNMAFERHQFRQAAQNDGETTDAYVTRLRQLIKSCEYPDAQVSDILRDQIIEKCSSPKLRVRFLREPNLTLEKLLDIARAHEAADEQAQQIKNDRKSLASHSGSGHNPSVVSSVKSKPSSSGRKSGNLSSSDKGGDKGSVKNHNRPSENFMSCTRCGRQGHTHKLCRIAIDKICNKCQHKGHFEKSVSYKGPKPRPK